MSLRVVDLPTGHLLIRRDLPKHVQVLTTRVDGSFGPGVRDFDPETWLWLDWPTTMPCFSVMHEGRQVDLMHLFYFRSIDGEGEPVTPEVAEAWLLRNAEAMGATHVYFAPNHRFYASRIDRRSEGINETGTYVEGIVGITRERE